MKKVIWVVVCVFLTLAGCANSNVVIPSAKPPDAFEYTALGAKQAADYCRTPTPQAASHPGYRQVAIIVSENGLPPPRLSEPDWLLEQNGKEIPIAYFREEPISLGIVLDTSATMESKIDSMRVLVNELVDRLNPEDQVFLIAFSSRAFVLNPFTGVHDEIVQTLRLLRAFGPANYPDAVVNGLMLLQNGCYPDKILLVIGGVDEALSKATDAQITADANKFQMRILTVGLGKVNTEALEAFAEPPGGGAAAIYTGQAEPGAVGYVLSNQLHSHYVLGFVTSATSPVRLELLNHPFGILRVQSKPANIQILTNN